MSKGNTTENDIIALVFHGTALSWNAETDLDIHLHTADPGEAGTSATNECAYGSYAPQTVLRDSSGWDVSGNQASNDDIIQFPQCTSGSETITHVSITPGNSTQILYSGALTSSLAVSSGIQPQFAANALVITED
jgi:hypothetical protein